MQVAEMIKFDDFSGGGKGKRTAHCIACEEMLADALDQTLAEPDQAWFDRHIAGCVDCSGMVADAQRGAAWLELLKTPRPEPSAHLMDRILAQTSGQSTDSIPNFAPDFAPVIGQPAFLAAAVLTPARTNLLAFRPRMPRFANLSRAMFEPRLAMTAAMAFFSIALTLNLTGVRLDQLHARNLNPANVKKTYYEASAGAVRYYDNLRVVRVMESRVDDLRDTNSDSPREQDRSTPNQDAAPPANPQENPPAQPKAAPGEGKPQSLNQTPAPAQNPSLNPQNGPVTRRETPIARPRFVTTAATLSAAPVGEPKKTRVQGGLA